MGRLQVRRLDIGFCPLCGRAATWVENARKLQDGTIICGECVRKLRVMHPYPQDPKDSNKDPLKNLTVQQAMEAMGKVTAFIENFREHFDYRFAVFTVNRINKEGGGLFKAPVHHLYGRVLYGSFSTHDDAMVKHQGKPLCMQVAVSPADGSLWRQPNPFRKSCRGRVSSLDSDTGKEHRYQCR